MVLKPDRGQIDANGEDISMVAVEIQHRQGRVVPVANHHEPAIERYHSRWDISRRGGRPEAGFRALGEASPLSCQSLEQQDQQVVARSDDGSRMTEGGGGSIINMSSIEAAGFSGLTTTGF